MKLLCHDNKSCTLSPTLTTALWYGWFLHNHIKQLHFKLWLVKINLASEALPWQWMQQFNCSKEQRQPVHRVLGARQTMQTWQQKKKQTKNCFATVSHDLHNQSCGLAILCSGYTSMARATGQHHAIVACWMIAHHGMSFLNVALMEAPSMNDSSG